MRTRTFISIILLQSSVISAYSQTTIKNNNIIPDTQVWSFIKYGGDRPSLYTGTATVSIPIYSYKDNDFSIPISLSYATNGYIPNVQAGATGLGWFLNTGGCITREIRGIPDDIRNYSRAGVLINGYYHYYKNQDPNVIPPDVFSGRTGYSYDISGTSEFVGYTYYRLPSGQYTETEPDVFHFNFCGHTGSFVLGFGKVHVFNTSSPAGEYAVDVSSFDIWGNIITIKTGDGYEYTFGFDSIYTEDYDFIRYKVTDTEYPVYEYQNMMPNQRHNTWQLTKIKTPGGRTVTLEYINRKEVENIRLGGERRDVVSDSSTGDGRPHNQDSFDGTIPYSYRLWYKNTTSQISKITIDNTIDILFSYNSNKPRESEKGYDTGAVTLQTLPMLNEINIKSKGSGLVLKKCLFHYTYNPVNTNSNRILFLTGLSISGEGGYSMSYNNQNEVFPMHGTSSIDHWGYYNRDPDYTLANLLPTSSVSGDFVETITSTNRNPQFNYAVKGTLQKIVYPTGGYTTYEYENHNYSYYLTRDYTSQNLPYLKKVQGKQLAGGVRVKKITDYPVSGPARSRQYIYDNVSFSNGILLNMPRYYYAEQGAWSKPGGRYYNYTAQIYSGTQLHSYLIDKTHIEYSDVTEKFDDGSFITYHYSNYRETPDTYGSTRTYEFDPSFTISTPRYANNFHRQPDLGGALRGRLMKTVIYNNVGDSIKCIRHIYNKEKQLKTLEEPKWTAEEVYIHSMAVDSYDLASTEEIEYMPSGVIKNSKNYNYNRLGQISSVSQQNSDGSVSRDSTLYISDILDEDRDVAQCALVSLNMLRSPVKTVQTVRESDDIVEIMLKSDSYSYTRHSSGLPCLAAIYSREPSLTGDPAPDWAHKVVTYDVYDANGRVVQMTDKYGVPTTYLWGYDGLYPVAIIVNARFFDFAWKYNLLSLIERPFTGPLPELCKKGLREIPNSRVTVYDYDPGIGLTSMIDHTGRETSYEYEEGKLIYIGDERGNLVKQFKYSMF